MTRRQHFSAVQRRVDMGLIKEAVLLHWHLASLILHEKRHPELGDQGFGSMPHELSGSCVDLSLRRGEFK